MIQHLCNRISFYQLRQSHECKHFFQGMIPDWQYPICHSSNRKCVSHVSPFPICHTHTHPNMSTKWIEITLDEFTFHNLSRKNEYMVSCSNIQMQEKYIRSGGGEGAKKRLRSIRQTAAFQCIWKNEFARKKMKYERKKSCAGEKRRMKFMTLTYNLNI